MNSQNDGYRFIANFVIVMISIFSGSVLSAYLWLSGLGITLSFQHMLAGTVLVLMFLFVIALAFQYARVKYQQKRYDY